MCELANLQLNGKGVNFQETNVVPGWRQPCQVVAFCFVGVYLALVWSKFCCFSLPRALRQGVFMTESFNLLFTQNVDDMSTCMVSISK